MTTHTADEFQARLNKMPTLVKRRDFPDQYEDIMADLIAALRERDAEIAALSATLAAANDDAVRNHNDAERYRWLRDGCRSLKAHGDIERILANWMEWTPLEGDAAIDAAISGQEGKDG